MGNSKILITGGAGYIGCVLVQKLMESKKMWSMMDFDTVEDRRWKKTLADRDWETCNKYFRVSHSN